MSLNILRSRPTVSLINRIGLPKTQRQNISLKPNFAKYKLISQPPGYVVGTVNDAYEVPEPDYYHGGYHWTYEKCVTIGLVPLAVVPFVAGVEYPMIDSLFSCLLMLHCHAGFMSCIIDYIPERVYGVWHKYAARLLTLGTFTGIYGLYELETNSNGLFDLIKSIWAA